jgi:hypothetical protein
MWLLTAKVLEDSMLYAYWVAITTHSTN